MHCVWTDYQKRTSVAEELFIARVEREMFFGRHSTPVHRAHGVLCARRMQLVFRDAVRGRRRHVQLDPFERQPQRDQSQVLRRANSAGARILAPDGHSVQVTIIFNTYNMSV